MWTIDSIIVLFALIGNIFLGLFTYSKNSKSATNRLFFFFTIAIAAYILINYLTLHQTSDIATLFWIRSVIAIALIINVLFFLLVSTFPQQKLQIKKSSLFFVLLYTFLLILVTYSSLVFVSVKPFTNQPVPGSGISLFLLDNMVFLGGGFLVLVQKLRKSTGIIKIQLRLFLLATIIMFSLILITNVLLVIIFHTSMLVGLLPVYTLVFLGIITYSIVRHRFLDINLIVARSVAYTLLIVMVCLFYAADMFVTSNYFFQRHIDITQTAVYTLITLFIAFSFQPLKEIVEKATNKIFYKHNYKSDTLLSSLTKIMATSIDLHAITEQTLDILVTTMNISHGAFILIKPEGIYPPIAKNIEIIEENAKKLISTFLPIDSLLIRDEIEDEQMKQAMSTIGFSVILPLIVSKKILGFLFLGEKKSGEIYTTKDINVLQIFSAEVSVAIGNAKSYEEISLFNSTLHIAIDKATKDLTEANDRLKELDKLKDEFVSVASHELRTPMTAIKSYLWMALNSKGGDLNEKQKYYIERGYLSVDRLIKLVNDMLNVSRIESGKITIDIKTVDMKKLAEEVIEDAKPRAEELGIQLEAISDGDIPKVMADQDKMKEVVFNLIGNSLKFTPKDGKITVTFKEKENNLEITVTDTGVGIDPQDMSKLFQKFGLIQGSYAANQSVQGTGLGLYISKSIIELHKGKIWVSSPGIGQGTSVAFTLPIASTDQVKEYENMPENSKKNEVELIPTQL